MDVLFELIFNFVGEILLEAGFEGVGWLFRRRWGRLIIGTTFAFGGGLIWAAVVGQGQAPVVATAVIGVQALTIPLLAGRKVLGQPVRRDVLIDLTLIGAAMLAGRWLGWAMA